MTRGIRRGAGPAGRGGNRPSPGPRPAPSSACFQAALHAPPPSTSPDGQDGPCAPAEDRVHHCRSMSWTVDRARELYGIGRWGTEFFDIDEDGEVVVHLHENGSSRAVSLKRLIDELRERGRGPCPSSCVFAICWTGGSRPSTEPSRAPWRPWATAGRTAGCIPSRSTSNSRSSKR